MGKMTLRDYYVGLTKKPSPSSAFIADVVMKTGRSASTVISWVTGKNTPRDIRDSIILSEMTGIPVPELFEVENS